ncbi:unnamed protein product, partial [marine sediment metagenome]
YIKILEKNKEQNDKTLKKQKELLKKEKRR